MESSRHSGKGLWVERGLVWSGRHLVFDASEKGVNIEIENRVDEKKKTGAH